MSSPHPNSISPHTTKSQSSAFVWPIPNSPSQIKPNNMNELSVREILDRYNEDPELLKYILTAKSEEDKKKAAKDTLKAEEARIQLRQMDLDLAREQTKASSRFERNTTGPPIAFVSTHIQHHAPPPPPPPPPQSAHPAAYGPYYGLAPVQQQVLARFHHPVHYGNQQQHPPASPSVPYPHSAHPLCPPSTSTVTSQQQQQFRQKSPSSPVTATATTTTTTVDDSVMNIKKRSRSSISSSPNEPSIEQQGQQGQQGQDKLSHNKVMEALKAKIQRGNGGPPSPLTASPIRSSLLQDNNNNKKRKPTLPRPVIVHQQIVEGSSPSPSPRSAKPVLPPIDTNLGRIDKSIVSEVQQQQKSIAEDTTITSSTSTSSSSSTNNSSTSTTHSSSHSSEKQQQQQQEIASPSDHILLNTRRARSLSPSSSLLLLKNE